MQIKPALYENLTPPQRITASLEALARDDEGEKSRLIQTCPKKSYTTTDLAFSGKMEVLIFAALAVENALRGEALNIFMSLYNAKNTAQDTHDTTVIFFSRFAAIHAAWQEVLEKQNLDPALTRRAFSKGEHGMIKILLDTTAQLPAPDPVWIEAFRDALEGVLGDVA